MQDGYIDEHQEIAEREEEERQSTKIALIVFWLAVAGSLAMILFQ